MRSRPLALILVVWFAVTGAAPFQASQMRAAAECRLPAAQMLAAMKQFPIAKQGEDRLGARSTVTTFYKVPSGMVVHGFPVVSFASAHVLAPGDEYVMLLANVKAPYVEVERTVLAANGVKACEPEKDAAAGKCLVQYRGVEGWHFLLRLKQGDDEVSITCSFSRDPA